jgi:hypothetical protein
MVASKAMTMAGLGSMVLGVVLIIVLYGIVPMIGYGSNSSVATIPTGSAFWTTISGFVTLSALMLFVGGFLGTLKGIRG